MLNVKRLFSFFDVSLTSKKMSSELHEVRVNLNFFVVYQITAENNFKKQHLKGWKKS